MVWSRVCFDSVMKHDDTIGCLEGVRFYYFIKEINLYTRAFYIVFSSFMCVHAQAMNEYRSGKIFKCLASVAPW